MAVHWPELGQIVRTPQRREPGQQRHWTDWIPSDPIGSIRSSVEPVLARNARAAGHITDEILQGEAQVIARTGSLNADPLSLFGAPLPTRPLPPAARKPFEAPLGHPVEDALKPYTSRIAADGQRHQPKHPTRGDRLIQAVAPPVAASPLLFVPPVAAGYAALDGYASTYDEAIAHGATDEQANQAGFENGAGQGVLAALPVPGARYSGQLIGKVFEKPVIRFLARGATTASTAAAYGGASQATNNFVAKQNYDPERPLDQGVGDAALLSGVAGLAGHGLGAGREAITAPSAAPSSRFRLPSQDRVEAPGALPARPPIAQEASSAVRRADTTAQPAANAGGVQGAGTTAGYDDIGAAVSRPSQTNFNADAAAPAIGEAGHGRVSTREQNTNTPRSVASGDLSDLGRPATRTGVDNTRTDDSGGALASPTDRPWTSEDLGAPVQEPAGSAAPSSGEVQGSPANNVSGEKVAPRQSWIGRLREALLGRTPDKFSLTGRKVVERMKLAGDIIGDGPLLRGNPHGLKLKLDDGTYQHIDHTIDMAHIESAVSYWNKTGISHGPKSREVRRFMLDPNNYELQPMKRNRSEGGKMKETYKLPAPADFPLSGGSPDG